MEASVSPPRSAASRWLRRGIVLLGIAFVLLAFAPWLAVRVGIVDSVLRKATAKLPGRVRFESVALGWFSSPRIRGLEVLDAQDHRVLYIGEVRTETSLLSLARDSSNLGTVRLIAPELDLVVTESGSNLETLLAPYLHVDPDAPKTAGKLPRIRLEIEGGIVRVRDAKSDEKWQYDRLTLAASIDGTDAAIPLVVSMDEAAGGSLHVDARIVRSPPSVSGSAKATRFPIDPLGFVARRFDAGAVLHGTLSGDVEGSASLEPRRAAIAGQVSGSGIAVHLPGTVADRLALEKFELPVDLTLDGRKIEVRKLHLDGDFGSLDVAGELDFSTAPEDWLARPGLSASVDLDLAKLARLLPATLALKPGLSLDSGRIRASLKTTASGGETTIAADVKTDDFRGRLDGREIVWKSPLTAEVRLRDTIGELPTIERLSCRADFLEADATQANDALSITAKADLGKLREHLARFADIGSIALAGEMTLGASVRREATGNRTISARIDLKKLDVGLDANRHFVQDELVVKTNSIARIEAGRPVRLEGSAVTVQSGPDWVWIQLQEAFVPSAKFHIHARVKAACELSRWKSKLDLFVPSLSAYTLGGSGEYAARLRYGDGQLELDEISASPQPLRIVGGGLHIDEPKCLVTGSMSMRLASGDLMIREVSAALTSGTATGRNLLVSSGKTGGLHEIRGSVALTGDLVRIRGWFADTDAAPSATGTLAATGIFKPEGGGTSLTLTGDIRDLAYRSGGKVIWREPKVDAVGTIVVAGDASKVSLEGVRIAGTGLSLTARGSLGLNGSRDLALDGNLDYDLDLLEPQLKTLIGGGFKVDGKDSRPYRIAGSLASDRPLGIAVGRPVSLVKGVAGGSASPSAVDAIRANGGLSWGSLSAMGLDISAAKFEVSLADGTISTTPIDATVNSGKLHLEPGFDLDAMTATFGAKTKIDRAKITPKMFASAIGYAAPMLANAARAEGELSIRLENGSIPLHDLNKANVRGEIVLHSGRVAAGPLLRELATLTRTPGEVELKKESVVKFHLIDGRVHHDKLELVFPDMTISTSGAVGLDGTLQLIAEMTIPTAWTEKLPLKGAILQSKIRIPLRGTLSQPKLDEAAMREHLKTLARAAGQNLIQGQLEKGLKNFLPKP